MSEVPKAAVKADIAVDIRFIIVSPTDDPPAGDGWLHEIKHDGHRLLAITDGRGSLTLRSRNGYDRTDLFGAPFERLAGAPDGGSRPLAV